MTDTASPSAPPGLTRRLHDPRVILPVAGAILVGAAFAWAIWLRPKPGFSPNRFETARDILNLYGLQLSFKAAKGVYANDLDALLSVSPDRAAIKARMALHMDMSTLAVVGNKDKFRLEANVLDADRTLVKIEGPMPPRARSNRPPAEASSSAGPDAGAPIAPPSAR